MKVGYASVEDAGVPASSRLPLVGVVASAFVGFRSRQLESRYLQHLDRGAVKSWALRLLSFLSLAHVVLVFKMPGWGTDLLALTTTLPVLAICAAVMACRETKGWAVVAVVFFFHHCYAQLVLLNLVVLTPVAAKAMLLGAFSLGV
jgi:hypothetical protein